MLTIIPISMTSALIDIIFICFYILYNVENRHKTDTESQRSVRRDQKEELDRCYCVSAASDASVEGCDHY